MSRFGHLRVGAEPAGQVAARRDLDLDDVGAKRAR